MAAGNPPRVNEGDGWGRVKKPPVSYPPQFFERLVVLLHRGPTMPRRTTRSRRPPRLAAVPNDVEATQEASLPSTPTASQPASYVRADQRSRLWEVFAVDNNTGRACCRIRDNEGGVCHRTYVMDKKASTNSLWQHLRSKHVQEYKLLKGPITSRPRAMSLPGRLVPSHLQQLTNKVFAKWVVCSARPLSVCNDAGLQEYVQLVSAARYQVPTVDCVKKHMLVCWQLVNSAQLSPSCPRHS